VPRRTKIFEEEEEKEEGFSKIKGKLTPNSLYFSPPKKPRGSQRRGAKKHKDRKIFSSCFSLSSSPSPSCDCC